MRWFEVALLKASYRIPQQLVTLTEAARLQVAEEFNRQGATEVIPHGAYANAMTTPPSGHRKLLVFGMLRRNKRILETIEGTRQAVAAGAQISLTIAGAPHKEDAGYWDECAARLSGAEAYIHTEIGFVPEPRLDQLIAECDAVVLPYEEFNSQSGVAVLAACSERLLLCTGVGGLAELMEQGLDPVLIGRPVTAQTVADAICRFAAMPVRELRAKASRSKRSLDAYLDWTRIGAKYMTLVK
jgi:glycosyltransferase involved in cell wall biosynthesis